MIAPAFSGSFDDADFTQPEVLGPAADMGLGWPSLPPGGQSGIGGKAQRSQQLCEKPIKIGIPRLRVLLLLYRFT